MTNALGTPPQPVTDADTAGFWDATADGRLAICRCQSCGLWLQPPLEHCRICAGPTSFEAVHGTGTIYSFIVQRQLAVPGYLDVIPYIVALVELDEQPRLRLPGRVVDITPEAVTCGMRVRAGLVALPGGDFTVPVFRKVQP